MIIPKTIQIVNCFSCILSHIIADESKSLKRKKKKKHYTKLCLVVTNSLSLPRFLKIITIIHTVHIQECVTMNECHLRLLSYFILGQKDSSYWTKMLEKVTKITFLCILREVGHTYSTLIIYTTQWNNNNDSLKMFYFCLPDSKTRK